MSSIIQSVHDADFDDLVLKADSFVLVDFWAEWCHPCKMLGPVLEEVAKERHGKLTIYKMNIDDNTEIPVQYGVRSIPTLLLLHHGDVVATSVGALSLTQLLAFVDTHI